MKKKEGNKWVVVVIVLLVLGFFSIITAGILSIAFSSGGGSSGLSSGNVALIPISGIIVTQESQGFFDTGAASSTDIVEFIESASKDSRVKAIVLEINSPGGSPVASDEIAKAVQKVNKPVVAWIREIGASGGYYVASTSDYIVAHEMAITGSIGVIGSYLEFAGFLQDYNVTYRRLVSGAYKDTGSPFKELTPVEEKKIQKTLDRIHDIFISVVASGRGMPEAKVREYATGEIFLGIEAKEIGLIDEVGGQDEITLYLEKTINITPEYKEYKKEKSFFDVLSEVSAQSSYYIGKGFAASFVGTERSPIRI